MCGRSGSSLPKQINFLRKRKKIWVVLALQAIVYCVIWLIYGYGYEAFRHRDNWVAAKLINDGAGNAN